MVIDENCKLNNNGYLHGSCSATATPTPHGRSSLRTYKRRKFKPAVTGSNPQLIDLDKLPSSTSSANSHNKMVKELGDIGLLKNFCEPVCDPKINCHSVLNGSDDCSHLHWKVVLESICQSLCPDGGGGGGAGLQNCIRDALHSNPENGHANMATVTVGHHDNQAYLSRTGMINGFSGAIKGLSAVNCNEAPSDSGHSTVPMLCEHIFYRLVMSGKFALLCKLLSENFPGLKAEKILDFSLINLRIKNGEYEHMPKLFSSDIQQVWSKLRVIGNEIVLLSHNLSELSRAFCRELGGAAENDISSDERCELPSQEVDVRIKQEEPDASVFCTCRQCGERSDGRDCLVCDSCEEMFHVSCLKPAVTEIPHKNWYCAKCTATGIGSPHEDCVVCERLIAYSGKNGIDAIPLSEEALGDDEESSDGISGTGIQVYKGSKRSHTCKLCSCMLNKGDEFRVCEHPYCSYKIYHTRCLTNKELKSYGPRWYCPSCLCRVCLSDKDDDDLCLCDGCDHGYHTYCMNPPRTSVPKGKWFCPKCDVGIKAIRKAKKIYEDLERKQIKDEGKRVISNSSKSKLEFEDAVSGSGGMDMLLTAARTLNDEEFDVHGKS